MKQYPSILVATDFSEHATFAVRQAALLAGHHGARLTLLHVVDAAGCRALQQWFAPSIDLELKEAQARSTLRGFAAETAGRYGVPAHFEVVVGEAFDEVLRASEEANLVVFGQRGRTSTGHLETGSTADRLLRLCRRAMLVVKQPVEGLYRSILVPVDLTASSRACLQAAAGLVRSAELHVVHAPGSHTEMNGSEPPFRMEGLAASSGADPGRLSDDGRPSPAWECSLAHADRVGADLIVVGKQGESAMAEFLLGSSTRRLLAMSRCDLLVMPRAALQAPSPPTAIDLLPSTAQAESTPSL
ncbi:universal stress protein [Ideonella sp. YS5]|uniref:universal stress protein n=1 Tax=Ideonella sp. YS5 TaxID=3453714 RepID=UPI003EEE151B